MTDERVSHKRDWSLTSRKTSRANNYGTYYVKCLVTRNTHMKYESPMSCGI